MQYNSVTNAGTSSFVPRHNKHLYPSKNIHSRQGIVHIQEIPEKLLPCVRVIANQKVNTLKYFLFSNKEKGIHLHLVYRLFKSVSFQRATHRHQTIRQDMHQLTETHPKVVSEEEFDHHHCAIREGRGALVSLRGSDCVCFTKQCYQKHPNN